MGDPEQKIYYCICYVEVSVKNTDFATRFFKRKVTNIST